MNFDLIIKHSDLFIKGIGNTLGLMALAMPIGFVIAILAALTLYYNWPGRRFVQGFVYIFRGSPFLVQLFLIYNGLAQFEFIRQSPLWLVLRDPFWCAVTALALNTGAYSAYIFIGAIRALPRGELEAARACGMSRFTQIRRIILPSSFRLALPAYGNETIFTLHSSALVSMVTITDILGAGRWVNTRYYVTFEGLVTAGILYAILTGLVVIAFRIWEKRLNRHLKWA